MTVAQQINTKNSVHVRLYTDTAIVYVMQNFGNDCIKGLNSAGTHRENAS